MTRTKRFVSLLLSLAMLFALLPASAFAEPIATAETAAPAPAQTAPVQPGDPATAETAQPAGPTALAQLQALAGALPEPAQVTAANAAEVQAQLQTFAQLYAGLAADEQALDEVCGLLARVAALQSALDALTGEDNTPALLATTENVAYVYATYNEETNTVTYNEADANATVVDENTTEWAWGTAGETTWYVVQGTVETSTRITVTGEVHLILANNCHLNAQAGIQVAEGNSLTIYAQTANGEVIDGTTGQLTATAAETNNAGIGGNGSTSGTAESSGPITIYGGIVTANGGNYAAGIGGGRRGAGSTITISGGTVKASSGTNTSSGQGAGIGGGYQGAGSNITISGGTVEAISYNRGAGIGGGSNGAGSNITISGGTVTAISKKYGAGIGGGNESASGANSITISGGTVTATSEVGGAGIGGGNNSSIPNTVSITGGFVVAQGGAVDSSRIGAGAAIGSGGGFGNNPSSGTETTFTTDDTNAVVLTKPGTADSTMTGTVYGSYTLAEDATVPEGTTLTIPANTTLTLQKGMTLTNNGAIIQQNGAVFNYALEDDPDPEYGILTGAGKVITGVSYLDYIPSGDGTTPGTFEQKEAYEYTVVTTQTTWGETGKTTWYVVNSETPPTITDRITVQGDVHLILADGATLTASKGITVTGSNSLTIYGQTEGTGKLATGTPEEYCAGIGGGEEQSSGIITINGGTVEATGGMYGAGIGGGESGSGTVTINGGTVKANGGFSGAGIGGGSSPSGIGIVTINGGTVEATGGSSGAGIGGGWCGHGIVTITGGTVTATGGTSGAGIGDGWNGSSSTFSTTATDGTPGNAFIVASSISDTSGSQSGSDNPWSGVIIIGNDGQVYGDSVTLTPDATVPTGATLTVPEASTLTIAEGTTLTNKGTINIEPGGAITNKGTLINDETINIEDGGTLTNEGTLINNGTINIHGTLANNGTIINNDTINGDVSGNQPGVYVTYRAYNTETGEFSEATAFATPVTSSMTAWGGTEEGEYWYVVNTAATDSLTITDRITVSGDVHLILANGCTLTASQGITVPEGNSLTIYGQTAGTGELVANGSGGDAGIGGTAGTDGDAGARGGMDPPGNGGAGSAGSNAGTVTIHGGTVTASSANGAGIGGGAGGAGGAGGNASDHNGGAGGDGGTGGNAGTVTIYGGTVKANSTNGAGIGGGAGGAGGAGGGTYCDGGAGGAGGAGGNAGTVTIHGGTVAASSANGAGNGGIGGGNGGKGGNGGVGYAEDTGSSIVVNASGASGTGGAGGAGGSITINGGTVNAAGIGGGAGGNGGDGQTRYENIGNSFGGAGGAGGDGGSITVSGGTVNVAQTIGGGAGGNGGKGSGDYGSPGSTGTAGASGSFSTTAEGNAFIVASAIDDQTGKDNWSGAIIIGNDGQVYGEEVTLATDATVPTGATLTIPASTTLTLQKGMTLTNSGAIIVKDRDGAEFYYAPEGDTAPEYGILAGNPPIIAVSYMEYVSGEFVENYAYPTPVTTQTTWGAEDQETWYVVNSEAEKDRTIDERITVLGNVHLILVDGAKLTASEGIGVNTASNSLTIYGQTEGTGELVATGGDKQAGIGGNSGSTMSSGSITVNGGVVSATGGDSGAGIGGGYLNSGTVTVNGGVVSATGGAGGAGIGGGYTSYRSGKTGTVTINGGVVNATGGTKTVNTGEIVGGAGIGGGAYGTGIVTITGGTVTGTGGTGGAGIGGGYDEEPVKTAVTIRGGTVTATGGLSGAGIGTGGLLSEEPNPGTIAITGGFIIANGGAEGTGNFAKGAGAAIGIGGCADWGADGSTNYTINGTEIDTGDFTNAVVLRKSEELGSTMTGQAYGTPTLTTDATVPGDATLTIPEGTSLAIASGTTLTNSGAIYVNTALNHSGTSSSYGTLTGDGNVYYLLTINGGTATNGAATYNESTYAEESAKVTLTPDDIVGLAFNNIWTASPTSANVTFTRVDENDETNQNYQFTMPAQVLTVTAGYENAPTYTVTIPATVTVDSTAANITIGASGVNVAEDGSLNVMLTATSGTGNAFTLALSGHPDVTLGYTMTLTETTVTKGEDDDAPVTTTGNTPVEINGTVLTIPGGTANSSGTAKLTVAMANQLEQYSGTYTGTVTFTVRITDPSTTP